MLQWRSNALTLASLLTRRISHRPPTLPDRPQQHQQQQHHHHHPTHSLRFDRMLISTCEWLRTAVCSSDSGPLLISQFSCPSPSQPTIKLGYRPGKAPSPPLAPNVRWKRERTHQLSNLIFSAGQKKKRQNAVSSGPNAFPPHR